LSVYMDGVRLNQPFGEIVSWDLIPRIAISSTTLMPGSNPLFGLNTLGGALSIQTKNGRDNPGTVVQAIYGSHVRRAVEFEQGAAERAALAAAGYTGVPTDGASAANTPFPFWRCLGNVLLNDEPAKTCNGLINQTDTVQHNAGVSAQATLRSDRGGQGNQFTW